MRIYLRGRLEVVSRRRDLAGTGDPRLGRLTAVAEQYRGGVRQPIDAAKAAGVIRPEVDSHLPMLANGVTRSPEG